MYLVCVSLFLYVCVHAYVFKVTCQDTNVKVKRQCVVVSFSLLTWDRTQAIRLGGRCLSLPAEPPHWSLKHFSLTTTLFHFYFPRRNHLSYFTCAQEALCFPFSLALHWQGSTSLIETQSKIRQSQQALHSPCSQGPCPPSHQASLLSKGHCTLPPVKSQFCFLSKILGLF